MSEQRPVLSKTAIAVIRLIAVVLLNLGIVFSAVYILFHLLEYYNPHSFIFANMPWLPIAIPILFVLSVLLFDFLRIVGAFKKRHFNKARMWLIVLCDLILFSALSLTLYLRTCTTSLSELNAIEEYSLPTPIAAPADTPEPSSDAAAPSDGTPDGTDGASVETPAPTEAPTPAIPLSEKFPEKFSDPPVEQSYGKTESAEALPDGTVKALIYTYSGRNAAVDIYHYQKGKLQYQVADIYVRDANCFKTNYSLSYHRNMITQQYAEGIHAIVSANGDNFNSGKIEDGLVIRNGAQLFPEDGSKQTKFTRDLCVLFSDGSMRVYDCVLDPIDYDEILRHYPRQAFYFGPKLLNDDGTAKTKFNSNLGKINPRTVLGYFEPGHYALVVVLGTRTMIDYRGKNLGNGKSPGMALIDLSALCEDLGFSMAYNLDGGGSSSMVWNQTVFGHNDRTHSDILAVVDP
ncbi:MAG: phosphodiester glycosidase family protein [Clostridia bacterium]|nr:phosphodiester glycosidase family protein [Clostridia bacterium]